MKKPYLNFIVIVILTTLLLSGCVSDENVVNDGSSDGNGNVDYEVFEVFDYPPFDLEKVAFILPLGGMIGSHVTPIDHQYYVSYDFDLGDDAAVDIDVYSPGDGTVTSIQHMGVAVGDPPVSVDDYRLVVQHTSTVSSIYIHVDVLSDKLAEFDPGLGEYAGVDVEVSAGEIIGWYGGSVDYNVVDEDVELAFVNPASYEAEPWKIHCPDPFDYFNESIKNTLVEKCLRTDEPVGGKICYDVDGRLVGSWFEEGTNGYAGVDLDRYWAGHLSVVYDSIDPDAVFVSIGTFVDRSEQFSVSDNSPDPADVSVDDGVVKYELVDFKYVKNDSVWDRNSLVKGLKMRSSDWVRGVILLQLVEDRKLKVEVFPDKTADEVSGFTDDFKFYVR